MSAAPPLETRVSLARYAHATAALADGFSEAEALDLAGIAKADWAPARVAWLRRIGGGGAESQDFRDYQVAHAKAEDAFGRTVRPIDSDLAMWLSFLALSEKSPNLGELLEKLALRTSDLSRLSRAWRQRFERDEKLTKQVVEIRKKPLPELVPLTVGKSPKAALPLGDDHSPAGSSGQPSREAPASVRPASAPDEIPLDRYAQLRSDIDRGDAVADVLALFRVAEATYRRADRYYRAAFETDAVLAADFRVLKAHADKTFRLRSQTSLAAPPREEAAPIEVPPASVRAPDSGLDARIVVSPAAATPLPPAPMERRPVPATVDIPTPVREKATLPFKTPAPGSAPPAPPPKAGEDIFAVAARMRARDAMTGTVEGGIATPKPLPFAAKKKPPPATVALTTPAAPSSVTPFKARPEPAKRPAPVAPPIDPALASRTIPPRRQGAPARALLTLEQHATMHAEVGVGFPLPSVLVRYGLDRSLREEVDEHYRLSFSRDPRVRAAWDERYRAVTAWMMGRR